MIILRTIRDAAVDAWRDCWAQRWFRTALVVDAVGLVIVAAILGFCYFDGKIGLIK